MYSPMLGREVDWDYADARPESWQYLIPPAGCNCGNDPRCTHDVDFQYTDLLERVAEANQQYIADVPEEEDFPVDPRLLEAVLELLKVGGYRDRKQLQHLDTKVSNRQVNSIDLWEGLEALDVFRDSVQTTYGKPLPF